MISLPAFSLVFTLMRRRGFAGVTQCEPTGLGNATAATEVSVMQGGVGGGRSSPQTVRPNVASLCAGIVASVHAALARGTTEHNAFVSSCLSDCNAEAAAEAAPCGDLRKYFAPRTCTPVSIWNQPSRFSTSFATASSAAARSSALTDCLPNESEQRALIAPPHSQRRPRLARGQTRPEEPREPISHFRRLQAYCASPCERRTPHCC